MFRMCTFNLFQESLFSASASVLVILAEFSRVYLLSDTCAKYPFQNKSFIWFNTHLFWHFNVILHRFTESADAVIARLEDEKMPAEDEHENQVRENSIGIKSYSF